MKPIWGRWPAMLTPAGLVLGGVVLAVIAGAGRAQDAPRPVGAPRAAVIAVVDMTKVLQNSAQWRDMADERNRRMATMSQTLKNLAQKAQVLRNDYDGQPPGSPERQATAQELDTALQELQRTRQQFEDEVGRLYGDATRTMFQQISQVVDGYAREHGIDLVLKKQTVDASAPDSLGQNIMVATTEVLYAGADLDISDSVVQRLNAAYPGPVEVK